MLILGRPPMLAIEKRASIYFPCWSCLCISVCCTQQPRFIIQSVSICFLTEEKEIIARFCFLYSWEQILTA